MAISIFPSTAAEFVSNNFVIDMNDTSNNTADTGGVKQAGPYSMSFSSGDTSFDVYLIDDEGNSVGYSNSTSINASGLFATVVILGVAQDEVISFTYQGSVNNADGEGDEPGAGAYLESISPSDLPTIDDTATVTGGNFGADTEIYFDSGQTSLEAKNITVNNSTELIVTRPDNLDANLDPWTLRAVTTGVPEATGSNANLLVDEVTAGATPVWVTSSLPNAQFGQAYTETLEATDADGSVNYSIVTGSLPSGLTLDGATGVIAGTPSGSNETFTARATDDGGNTNEREFTIGVLKALGGSIELIGSQVVHTFSSNDDFEPITSFTGDYLIVGGGGGGGYTDSGVGRFGGGGGAGGFLAGTHSFTAGTLAVTVGSAGSGAGRFGGGGKGGDSQLGSVDTAIGGGGGGIGGGSTGDGGDGGSGGGAGGGGTFGEGTPGQGFDGGDGSGGGGGGASEPGQDESGGTGGDGGDGLEWSVDGIFYAGGGPGARSTVFGLGSIGQGGRGIGIPAQDGTAGVVKVAY